MEPMKRLPVKGIEWEEIKTSLKEFKNSDHPEMKNRLLSGIHKGDEKIHEICRNAFNLYFHGNAFLGSHEQGMAQMQKEVLEMAVGILNGGDEGRANMTTGGTESIFCAMHAAREWAKENRPEIKGPYEMITPWTAHAAFEKAAHYLGIEMKRIDCHENYRADVQAMEEAITENTIIIMGSAPCWGLGLIDPIPQIAEIAVKHNLWMHSDCCVGGYLLPWIEKLGYYSIPPYDFRVPGVCSISADLAKHGYAAKPASTVLFRSEKLQKYNPVPVDDWQSGHYETHGMVGTRPAGSIASAWAVMHYLGEEGYLDVTRRSLEIKERMIKEIEAIDGLECMRNECLLIPIGSESIEMINVFGGMVEKGYFPFGTLDPLMLHVSAENVGDEVIELFLKDLREVAEGVKAGTVTAEALARYM